MDLLNYKTHLKTKSIDGVMSIFDESNKNWKKLLPEEVVRQCLFHFLRDEKGVPAHMMNVEHTFHFKDRAYRADLIVLDKNENILLIAECKSFNLPLKQKQLDQVALYNRHIQAHWLLLTNGYKHLSFHKNKINSFKNLNEIPTYRELTSIDDCAMD